MKKTLLKLSLAFLFLIGISPVISSCSDNKNDNPEEIITFNKLPATAQEFLNTYFSGKTILKIEKEEGYGTTIYEVYIEGGYEADFNSEGEWVEVDAPDGMTIPDGIVPEEVQQTLNQQYPDYGVNEINKTGQGYKVELTNGQGGDSLNLMFNMAGEIIGIENAY